MVLRIGFLIWSFKTQFNRLNAKLNPIYHLLALLGAHHIIHISRIMVNTETFYELYYMNGS